MTNLINFFSNPNWGIFSVLLISSVLYFADQWRKKDIELLQEKREVYLKFIKIYFDLLYANKQLKNGGEKKALQDKCVINFINIKPNLLLIAKPRVIKKFGVLLMEMSSDSSDTQKDTNTRLNMLFDLIKEMRRDMGYPLGLSVEQFAQFLFQDPDEVDKVFNRKKRNT